MTASEYCEQGRKMLDAGNLMVAMEFFQAAIEVDKHFEKAYMLLSEVYVKQDKTDKAKATLYALLAVDPNNGKAIEKLNDAVFAEPDIMSSSEPSFNYSNQRPISTIVQSGVSCGIVYPVDLPWGVHNRLYVEKINETECMVVPPTGMRSLPSSNATDRWKGYTKPHGQVTIPAIVILEENRYRVVAIGNEAFAFCKDVNRIVLPPTIKYVGQYAFYATSIVSIDLPNSISQLFNDAFAECKQLATITLPTMLKQIHNNLLHGTSVSRLDIPKSVRFIGDEFVGPNPYNKLVIKMHGKPPKITPKTFSQILSVKVYVPKQLRVLYNQSEYWKFKNLISYI